MNVECIEMIHTAIMMIICQSIDLSIYSFLVTTIREWIRWNLQWAVASNSRIVLDNTRQFTVFLRNWNIFAIHMHTYRDIFESPNAFNCEVNTQLHCGLSTNLQRKHSKHQNNTMTYFTLLRAYVYVVDDDVYVEVFSETKFHKCIAMQCLQHLCTL